MAASYQPGSASSPTDLLQKLVTWLVAQGWTQNMSQAEGTGWRAHLSKGGVYVNMRATPGSETLWGYSINRSPQRAGIGIYTGTGYNGSSAWNAQAGGPIGSGQTYTVGCIMQTGASILAYHFFDDGADNIVVVIERTAGVFGHMGWGPSIVKAGTWTGGAYFFAQLAGYSGGEYADSHPGAGMTASCPFATADAIASAASFVRADVDSFTGKWVGIGYCGASGPERGYTGKRGQTPFGGFYGPETLLPVYTTFQNRLTSAMNAQANLLPIRVFVKRDAGGYSLIGDVPNIFLSNATENGFAPSTVYPLGSDNYMLFHNFAVLKKA